MLNRKEWTNELKRLSNYNNKQARKRLNVPKGYHLHHINEKLKDEDPYRYAQWNDEDLVILSPAEHCKQHMTGKVNNEETRERMSKWQKGGHKSEQWCLGHRISMIESGKWLDPDNTLPQLKERYNELYQLNPRNTNKLKK